MRHPWAWTVSLLHPLISERAERTGLSALSRWTIIGASIAAGVVLLLLAAAVLWCCLRRRSSPRSGSAGSDALYYKFDEAVAAARVAAAAGGRGEVERDGFEGERKRNGSSRRKPKPLAAASSYASTEDAIAAPRALEEDVPSSGVAFLDDYGRPIASPIGPQRR